MTQPYRIRSPETWTRARDDYLSGLDAETVCRRHDLGLSAFRRRAREEGWRRADQPDPEPDEGDLSIYADVDLDDQVEMARLRYIQALDRGHAIEATRWRRLWREIAIHQSEHDAREAMAREGLTGPGLRRDRLIQALEDIAGTAPAPENVHDVHSTFSSADSSSEPPAPLSRAERRRRERDARRMERSKARTPSEAPG